MEIEIGKREISGAKLFELDPKLFDRRLETHTRLRQLTEKQREEYPDRLPCVLCGHKCGTCDCNAVVNFPIPQKEAGRKKKG
jgi:hypothetical protein